MTGKSLPLPTIYSLNQPLKEVLPLFLLKQGYYNKSSVLNMIQKKNSSYSFIPISS